MPRDVSREAEGLTAALVAVLLTLGGLPACAADAGSAVRGAYLANAADCVDCHTDSAHSGQPYAGGRALATRFGTFYSPNITPDGETGIGDWSEGDIVTLLATGQTPDFDFVGDGMAEVVRNTSRLDDSDRRAIASYLRSLPPIRSERVQ